MSRQGRQDRRDRQICRGRPGARSMPRVSSSRRALSTITAITTRRSLGPLVLLFLRPRRDLVIFGNCSLSLAPVRKGKQRRLSEFSPMSRRSRWRCSTRLRSPGRRCRIPRSDGPQPRRQCRQFYRPHRGALLRDGRRLPEAHGDDDEIRQMQDLVRDGMKAGALGLSVSRNQAISTRRASTSRRSGRTKRRSLRWATCCASSAPASSSRAAAAPPR